jgi:hypothetical protein
MTVTAISASFSFCRCFLASFLAFLLVMGGGELARDADAEVTDMNSTRSLIGVPGWFVEVILGRLDACLLAIAAAGVVTGVATVDEVGRGGGVSVRGVSVIRSVLGCVTLLIGEPVDIAAAAGVPGLELIVGVVTEPARDVLVKNSGLGVPVRDIGSSRSFSISGAIDMLSLPGWARLVRLGSVSTGELRAGSADSSFDAASTSLFSVVCDGIGFGVAIFGVAVCFFSSFAAFFFVASMPSVLTGVPIGALDCFVGVSVVALIGEDSGASTFSLSSRGAASIETCSDGICSDLVGVTGIDIESAPCPMGGKAPDGNRPGGSVGVARLGGSSV